MVQGKGHRLAAYWRESQTNGVHLNYSNEQHEIAAPTYTTNTPCVCDTYRSVQPQMSHPRHSNTTHSVRQGSFL